MVTALPVYEDFDTFLRVLLLNGHAKVALIRGLRFSAYKPSCRRKLRQSQPFDPLRSRREHSNNAHQTGHFLRARGRCSWLGHGRGFEPRHDPRKGAEPAETVPRPGDERLESDPLHHALHPSPGRRLVRVCQSTLHLFFRRRNVSSTHP